MKKMIFLNHHHTLQLQKHTTLAVGVVKLERRISPTPHTQKKKKIKLKTSHFVATRIS
jgi:hypothetical protein